MTNPASRGTKTWHPTRTRNAWLAVGALEVDERYERPLSQTKVAKIAAELDPDAIGNIMVSERIDARSGQSRYVILDGQHRVAAVRRLWGDRAKVPTLIYQGLTLEQEATIYVQMNDVRTKPRPIDIFRAKVVGHDDEAAAITGIIERHGLIIGSGPGKGRLAAVKSLSSVYRGAGADILDRTIGLLTAAYATNPYARTLTARGQSTESEALQGQVIYGLGAIVGRHRHRLDDGRMVKVLTGIVPRQIIAKARFAKQAQLSGAHAYRVESLIADQLVALYNRGLRNRDKALVWEDRPSVHYWIDEAEYETKPAAHRDEP